MAVVGAKLDGLNETVTDFISEQRRYNERHEADVETVKVEQARLSERVKILALVQTGISAALSALAGFVGSLR